MSHQSPWQPIHMSTARWLIRLLVTLTLANMGSLVDSCDQCLNDSACRLVTKDNVTMTTCLCLQGWIGSHCEAGVKLTLVNVTTTTVTLKAKIIGKIDNEVKVSNSRVSNTRPNEKIAGSSQPQLAKSQPEVSVQSALKGGEDDSLLDAQNYHLNAPYSTSNVIDIISRVGTAGPAGGSATQVSVHYWPSRDSNLCNIIPRVSRDLITIHGLHNMTAYVFCILTSQQDLCVPKSRSPTSTAPRLGHNCVMVRTADSFAQSNLHSVLDHPTLYIIIASCVSGIAFIVLIIVMVIGVRQYGLLEIICVKNRNRRKKSSSYKSTPSAIQMAKLDTSNQVFDFDNMNIDSAVESLIQSASDVQPVEINPPRSPGKPRHQLVKERTRGYAAFAAKNEQTIPLSAVVEYDETGDGDIVHQ